MNLVLPQIKFIEVPRLMSVSYTAMLPVRDQTVLYVSGLLHAERVRRGSRKGSRVLSPFKQAIVLLRWYLDGTRVKQLAVDNEIGKSTVYAYLHEGITVLAAQAPALESALLAAKMARVQPYLHRRHPDRDRPVPHPRPHQGRGPVVVGQTRQPRREHPGHHRPDGWPLWTSDIRPGCEHETTALREHLEILPALTVWNAENHPTLGDLGYEGEADTITVAFKKPKGGELT